MLSSLELPGWFRNAYFEYHAHVRWRFKLASGLGEPWIRDGSIPQGCPLRVMLIVAVYLSWCKYLAAQEGVEPQLYADNLKCVSRDPGVLLHAGFTTGYVRLVGQEPALGKCVLMITSGEVGKDMRDWVFTHEGERWTVKLDVRDPGGHLDSTFRGWSATLASVRLVISRLVLTFVLPLDFMGLRVTVGRLSMVLRPLFWLRVVYVSCALPYLRLSGPVVSLWSLLVRCIAWWMVLRDVILRTVLFGFGFVWFIQPC